MFIECYMIMTSALKKLQQHNMFCILKAEKNMEALISHV